ncbi:MAG: biopolymer transport protein ExbD [Parvicellaceae bacterium]|jgi:biopolymer transport protein ExbD
MGIKRQNKIKAEGGMSSMTDLVFLLLIFFVILSTMASPGITVKTPKGDGNSMVANDKATVAIRNESGITRFYVNDREFTFVNRDTKELDGTKLAEEIVKVMGEDNIVELKAAEDVAYVWPAQVINVVKQNKWTIVLVYRSN